jgi:hypothetical protein
VRKGKIPVRRTTQKSKTKQVWKKKTKGVIKNHNSKKDRQHNGQKKIIKKNNDPQRTTPKTKD